MIRRILTAVALLVCAAGVARVDAQRSHFGVRGGYNFDMEEGSIGAQLHLPLSSSIELYPSFDYYFVNTGNLLGISGDLKFRTPGAPVYFGGGLNVLTGDGNSDTGFDLFGGLETRLRADASLRGNACPLSRQLVIAGVVWLERHSVLKAGR